ncbi:MAG: hypothetical protein ACE5HQ_14155 [Gemmatimonadota bacterium]
MNWITYGIEEDGIYTFALVAGKKQPDGSFETDLSRVLTLEPYSCGLCGAVELYRPQAQSGDRGHA